MKNYINIFFIHDIFITATTIRGNDIDNNHVKIMEVYHNDVIAPIVAQKSPKSDHVYDEPAINEADNGVASARLTELWLLTTNKNSGKSRIIYFIFFHC